MHARPPRVLNKAPAAEQITAEQLIRDARDAQDRPTSLSQQQGDRKGRQQQQQPVATVVDPLELDDLKLRKRKQFEDALRRNRHNLPLYIKYATFEATHKEWDRYVWDFRSGFFMKVLMRCFKDEECL